jgi:LuxR family maltose regulon positive regulatory protein
MGIRGDPVLWSKLCAPTAHGGMIERPRLRHVLGDARIWIIDAPAGYGKTTLMTQCMAADDRPATWLTIDSVDAQGTRMWTHLVAGLEAVDVEASSVRDLLIDGRVDAAIDELLSVLEREERPLVIVFDDVHEIAGSPVLGQLGRFIRSAPDHIRLGVLTRARLDLPLPRLLEAGQAIGLDAAALAFTVDEATAAMAHAVDGVPDGLDAVVARLEGWPAGVRLAQLAAHGGHDLADLGAVLADQSTAIARYLTDEIIARQPSETREFMLLTSVLDDLTPGACDAVTVGVGGLRTLRQLAAEGVFTSLIDPATNTYRFHGLLRDHLRALLDERPSDERNELHRRAARWFAQINDLDAAIRHSVEGNDTATATSIMAEHYIEAANLGQIDRMWGWVTAVGPEAVLRNDVVAPMPAWASLNQQRYDEIEPWLQAMTMVDDVTEDSRASFDIHAETVRCHQARHEGRLADAVVHGSRAVALVDRFPGGAIDSSVLAACGAAVALTGGIEADGLFRRAIEVSHASGEMSSLVMSYSYLGFVAEDRDTAAAASDTALAVVTTDHMESFHQPAMAWFVRGRVAFDEGRVGDAETAIVSAARLATAGNEPALTVLIEALRARVLHLLGRTDEQRAALRAADVATESLEGADWVGEQVRAAHADTRFTPLDGTHLPIGARELTERELAVLRLMPHGLARRELAAQLFVSENTVKTHLTSIRRKLGATGRDDVVARAREVGVLPADG